MIIPNVGKDVVKQVHLPAGGSISWYSFPKRSFSSMWQNHLCQSLTHLFPLEEFRLRE